MVERLSKVSISDVVLPLLVALLYWVPATTFAQAESGINITADTSEIYSGDVVVLEIESIGLLESLNIDPLLTGAKLLRETTGTRIAVVEGKVVEIALRRMEFIPENEGITIFGPLQAEAVGGLVTSNSVSVKVLPAPTTAWKPSASDATISVTLSKTRPIFGEQLSLDIELRHSYAIADENISLPSLNLFDVVELYKERRTIDNQSNERLLRWQYLIHPRESGRITLDNVRWSGTMVRSRTQRGTFDITSDSLALDVQPSKIDKGDWWLPARSLSISEEWSQDVKTLSAGDEVIRTITVEAEGALANQLPEVKPLQSRAIQSALINTTRTHTLIGERTVATGSYTFRVTALSPIPVFLDTVRVPWWNTVTSESKEAILPARRINVGLPDRADLLAQLSLQGSLIERLRYRLQSVNQWQYGVVALLGLVSAGLLLWLFIPLLKDGKKMLNRWGLRGKLKKMLWQERWQDMFELLHSEQSNNLAPAAMGTLFDKLNRTLFSDSQEHRGIYSPPTELDIDSLFVKSADVERTEPLPLPVL